MSFDTTILKKTIERIKQAYESGQFADALTGALNSGNALMQIRIFGDNKDTKGNDFGIYIGKKQKVRLIKSANRLQNKRNKAVAGKLLTPYQIKRAKAGRQTAKKDLEFTGGLRRSIEIREENKKAVVLEFSTDESALIARGQENQITNIRNGKTGSTKGDGIKIFNLDDNERNETVRVGLELINQILKPVK